MNASLTQGRYLLALLRPMLADLEPRHVALEPAPKLKTAGWMVGHLAVTGDFARRLCGAEVALCPREWRALCAPGTRAALAAAEYPPLAELCAVTPEIYASLFATAERVSPDVLAIANPYEAARNGFPTVGDFVAYLASGHFGYHLGQLALWRAAAGLPARGTR